MTELKTLKEIKEHQRSMLFLDEEELKANDLCNHYTHGVITTQETMMNLLRVEAIKDVLHLREELKLSINNNPFLAFHAYEKMAISKYIMWKNNLSEEDLK